MKEIVQSVWNTIIHNWVVRVAVFLTLTVCLALYLLLSKVPQNITISYIDHLPSVFLWGLVIWLFLFFMLGIQLGSLFCKYLKKKKTQRITKIEEMRRIAESELLDKEFEIRKKLENLSTESKNMVLQFFDNDDSIFWTEIDEHVCELVAQGVIEEYRPAEFKNINGINCPRWRLTEIAKGILNENPRAALGIIIRMPFPS